MKRYLVVSVTIKSNIFKMVIQTVANVLTGHNSAQCRVGRANDNNESKKGYMFCCYLEIHALQRSSDNSLVMVV